MTQDISSKLQSDKIKRWLFLLISIALFLISLTQDAYCTHQNRESLTAFLLGILVLPFGCLSGIAWWANPLLFISWVVVRNTKVSYRFSLAATLLAASFLLFHSVLEDEAGHYSTITAYKSGYWLWLASSLTMLVGNWIVKQKQISE